MASTPRTEASIHRTLIADGIVQLELDMPGKSANVMTQAVLDELDRQLQELESSNAEELRGLVITSAKPKIFVAGADLVAIANSLDWPDQEIKEFCWRGQRLLARLGQLPYPSVAAIHGICVGGGLELALACDFRVCSDAPQTMLGLPEVKLGLIPGWCGTVRTPRLIGLAEALDLVTSGRLVSAAEADALLLIDEIVPQEELTDRAVQLIRDCQPESLARRRKQVQSPVISGQIKHQSLDRWNQTINAQPDIHPYAPEIVAEHMIRAAALDFNAAAESEAEAMTRVWGSDANRGLLHMFFVDERIKKEPGWPAELPTPAPIQRIGILGTGQMGSQIARALARVAELHLYDARRQTAEQLQASLDSGNSQRSEKRTHVAADLSELASCDLIIESIVENLAVKRNVFNRLVAHVSSTTVLATNTSAIPVAEIARGIDHPSRVVGVHFCHPIQHRKLCEIVPTPETDPATLSQLNAALRSIGKWPLVVGDAPGFVVNRILAPLFDQAITLLDRGVPLPEIERAGRQFGFQIGPFEFIDAIGVDTLFYAGTLFAERLPHLIGRSKTLPGLIKANRLGKKTGGGFFDYASPNAAAPLDPQPSPQLAEKLPHLASIDDPLSLNEHEIQMNMLMPMLAEAVALLDDNVVRDARDIDFCSVHGCGFPAYRGGLMHWADAIGCRTIVKAIESVRNFRPQLKVPQRIEQMAESGGRFHDR